MLLVATPALIDPSFVATVILLLDVNGDDDPGGAVGVVVNRPSGVAVSEVLLPWAGLVDEPEVLYQGGPVSTEDALGVAWLRAGAQAPVGFRSLGAGGLGLVDLDTPVELIRGALAGLRIYAGYAGWGRGQLEREVDDGFWYVVPGTEADGFCVDTTMMWRDVLRRQPGDLAWTSTRPTDANLN